MKKDIEIPISKNVHLGIVHEWDEEFLGKNWNAYIINNKDRNIEAVIVVSIGYEADRKTSTMRHIPGDIPAKTYKKIEVLQEAVLALNNEFFLTYFVDGKLYEKRFVFEKHSIKEANFMILPVMKIEGIMK